jgi:serine/threonine protein kinase
MPDEPTSSEMPSADLPQTSEYAVSPEAEAGGPEPTSVQEDNNSSTTDFIPSFRAPVPGQAASPAYKSQMPASNLPCPGERIGDFEILEVLGKGAFATVFLAREVPLDRPVALKVSANRGSEARTLASLEHDHIVRVFSEKPDAEHNLLLICMQFVPGTTLEKVIKKLAERDPGTWSGAAILETIDELSTHPAMFDPAALRDREELMGCDFVEAVCWIGARLAEALAHAHNQRVLHRDIKPANILMNRYGRPLLADFNVSLDPKRMTGPAGEIFGGTLGYMAPEHIDAFNPAEKGVTPADVDERSDIYSLGLVFYELLVGKLPFGALPRTTKIGSSLRELAAQRRAAAPSPRAVRPEIPEVLDRVVRRCLAAEPDKRYQSAAELAEALKGCQEHRHTEKDLPRGGLVTRATLRHPVLVGMVLMFLPQVLGTAVNILYNTLRIVGKLTDDQQATFMRLVPIYDVVAFGLTIWVMLRLLAPIVRLWRQLSGADLPDDAEVARVRRHALRLPGWVVVLAALGWLPGGVIFPLGVDWLSGPIADRTYIYSHFMISFTISGLIALTYSLFAVQFLVLRVLYPRLWGDARGLRQESRAELGPLDWRLAVFQFLAGLIPLIAAVLLVFASPEKQLRGASYQSFRLLLTALIVAGMLGFAAALSASRQLQQILTALIGGGRRRRHGHGMTTTLRTVTVGGGASAHTSRDR